MSGKLCIANEAVDCIWCMFNEESSVFVNWIDTHFPVTWTDQYGIFPVNRAFLSFYFSGKEIIIGREFLPQAAGKIHSDFERGFIRAEIVSYDDLMDCGTYTAAKEKGLVRLEGKEYVVQDGDIILFRFNV